MTDPRLPLEDLPAPPETRPFALLDGIRVLDLTTSIAGPYATMMLADMGAEVIKIERPGAGDDTRAWGPPFLDGESLWYHSVNRNKASVALDYAVPQGRAVLDDLVRVSDVLVNNQVPRVQEKLGTDYATIKALRENIVFASLTGFGLTGPRRDMTCYDLIAEGYSGVMDLTGEPEGPPQKVGTPAADMLAGMDLAFAVACAIADRRATGRGHLIDVSLVESMTRFMTPRLVSYLGSGELARRSGGRDSVIAIYQTFETADEPITLGLGNDAIFRRFWAALGEPSVADDPRFASNADRRAVRGELVAMIQARLAAKPRAHWLALLAEHRVPAGPINRLDQVSADPALHDRGLFWAMSRDGKAPSPQVGTGIHIDFHANAPRTPPPPLGADGAAVLKSLLGMTDAGIEALRSAGTLG